ncbi:MAG: ATP-binding cassette domain-containing protein [Desulfobulbaceae bacterium]|nr:ATP-binding cassette domain-containing protein [Desulfobulbaceae bacterium]
MISISSANKGFDGSRVLDKLSFDVNLNSICAVVGPSACGKSTILNLICGLDQLDSGNISLPEGNSIGYMMQEPMLLPWRTLEENATLGVEVKDTVGSSEVDVEAYFKNVGLAPDRMKYPSTASGGMKQRVALLRTLLLKPDILLLDEPFSSLDFDIKLKVQKFLLRQQAELGSTILWVTHDIEDAIAISDRVVILSDKPAKVKSIIDIDLHANNRSPVEARKSLKFRDYFLAICEQLKYLDNGDDD